MRYTLVKNQEDTKKVRGSPEPVKYSKLPWTSWLSSAGGRQSHEIAALEAKRMIRRRSYTPLAQLCEAALPPLLNSEDNYSLLTKKEVTTDSARKFPNG